MVQLNNPHNSVPAFGAQKKYHYHLTENFHRNFRTNGKHSWSRFSVAGLDRAKFGFNRFESFLFIVVIVISILLKTAF